MMYQPGHAFLSFKNTSTQAVTVGSYEVAVNEEITIGTFDNQSQHDGVWYNLESYFINEKGKFPNHVSITMNVTQADVNSLNILISKNDDWGYTTNCSYFATKLWNEVSTTTLSAGDNVPTPTTLVYSIKAVAGYVTNRTIQENYNLGYTKNGNFEPVLPAYVNVPEEFRS